MSTYDKLADVLAARDQAVWKATFAELERLIGAKLPASAFKYAAWWSNNPSNNSMTKVWLNAGWRTEQVDVPGQTVVFRRVVQRLEAAGAPGFGDRGRPYETAAAYAPEIKSMSPPSARSEAAFDELEIGQAVKHARERLRMSQAELARRLDMSTHAIARIERGERVHQWTLVARVAAALHVTPNELLGFSADEATVREERKPRIEDIYGCMKGTIKIMPGVDVTAPVYSDEEWAEIEAARDRKWDEMQRQIADEKERR